MPESQPRLHDFPGGLHLAPHKEASTAQPLQTAALPARVVLPLQQHIGEAAVPLVRPGDRVLTGQVIARSEGYVSAPVHATVSGTVTAIADQPVPHPSGLLAPCIVIESDGRDQWFEPRRPLPDWQTLDPERLRQRIREMGIVGLGGAGFPSAVKMNPGGDHPVTTLVINGAECEPYISCDDMLMRERAAEVIEGCRIIRHVVQAERCLIGIEDNKPQAITAMRAALGDATDLEILSIPTRYPTGGEKQLIRVLTGREVPSNGLPVDVGVLCHNVGTAAAVYRAVRYHEPLISRIVTLTGAAMARPGNWAVRLGTLVSDLVAGAGGYTPDVDRLIMGGPMMGFALASDEVPITKTLNCILAADRRELPPPPQPLPCIRCTACVDVCPAQLLPHQLYWYARARDFDKTQDFHLFDCIECGCCSYVCPSHIPLVQYYRFAKTEIWHQEQERRKADLARRRHEFRLARLEREKAERARRIRERKKAVKPETGGDDKQAVIQQALERARARKQAQGATPRNTDNLTEAQQRQIEAAEARRRAAGKPAPGGRNEPD